MSNVFEDVLNDPAGVENKLLGPSYPYYKNIKTPSELGMSSNGSMTTLGKDIDGLIQYVEVLVTGKSKASMTNGPLGNKFFLQTGAKCVDTETNNQVDRFVYINNVPVGNVPFISSGMGVNFSEFKGLIPGTMGNLSVLSPFGIMQSFLSGSTPPCKELTMDVIDINNNKTSESNYVTLVDIKGMDPCIFPKKSNPLTGDKCRETFQTISDDELKLPTDPLVQLYFASLAGVSIYILYRLMEKSH